MKKILIIGSHGQVGWELCRTLSPLGKIYAHDHDTLDITSLESIRIKLDEIKPNVIVNAAAYTAVDKAEADSDKCRAINEIGPKFLAEEAKKIDALLVHYSTDYVFDGTSENPYKETDIPNPQNVYAESKLAGDLNIANSGCKYLILRTSWVYGSRGQNFLLTMLKLAKDKDLLKIVSDQVGAPTWSRLIAEATSQLVVKFNGQSGIYNVTSTGKTSWYGFAEAIFELQSKKNTGGKVPTVQPIPTSDYPTPAKRPAFSLLCHEKLSDTFGIKLPDWKDALQMCFEEIR